MAKTYNILISHSWAYGDAYDKLVNFLEEKSNFSFKNHSIPKDSPIHTSGTDKELYEAITRKMSGCHCVLILAGVYASYSKWIKKEIKIAQQEFNTNKPIIAIEPWASEKTSTLVKDNADAIAKWNTDSIVKAIREHSL